MEKQQNIKSGDCRWWSCAERDANRYFEENQQSNRGFNNHKYEND